MENAQTRTLMLGVALADLPDWIEVHALPAEVFVRALDIVARGLNRPVPKCSGLTSNAVPTTGEANANAAAVS